MKENASGRSSFGAGSGVSGITSGSQPLRTTCMRSAASGYFAACHSRMASLTCREAAAARVMRRSHFQAGCPGGKVSSSVNWLRVHASR